MDGETFKQVMDQNATAQNVLPETSESQPPVSSDFDDASNAISEEPQTEA